MAGHKNAYDCIKAFSETDFTEDLKKFDVPTLIVHGDDDQIVPIGASARAVGEARQERDAEGLPGRAARPRRHAQGPAQRRPAGVRQGDRRLTLSLKEFLMFTLKLLATLISATAMAIA